MIVSAQIDTTSNTTLFTLSRVILLDKDGVHLFSNYIVKCVCDRLMCVCHRSDDILTTEY